MRGAGGLHHAHLVLGPHAGQALAVELELAVHAEHELARHADLDAEPGVLLAQHAAGGEAGEEVGVAGRAGGVHVDAVGAGLDHVVGDEVDVVRPASRRPRAGRRGPRRPS